MNKTTAIILTHNRKAILERCVEAVLCQKTEETPDIIVVDNGSTDGTRMLFEDPESFGANERIHYYNTGANTGCAGGFSFGMRKAADLGYDYVWLLDDDCIPSETALEKLLVYAREHDGEFGFLCSKVLWRDGSISIMNVPRKTLTGNVTDMSKDLIPVTMASFASLLIPVSVIRAVGLPYREFFIWTDDWEYTRRISASYRCMFVTGSIVTHYIKTNAKADISTADEERLHRYRYLYRNDVFLYRREGIKGFAYEAVRLPLHLARIALSKNSLREKKRRARILINGTVEGLSFYPAPERLPK